MRVTNGNLSMRDSGAFASFANDTLTVDFKALGRVHNELQNVALRYNAQMQEAREAARSAQGEVTRCNNEIARLHERLDLQARRIDELEAARLPEPEPNRSWLRRLFNA